jgi:hypothetical protein
MGTGIWNINAIAFIGMLGASLFDRTTDRKLSDRKATAQMEHLVLPDTEANPSQNQKSHFLPTHLKTATNLTEINC